VWCCHAASLVVHHRIAEWAIQSIQNRRLEQEVAHPFGLTLEHLFDEIVHDIAIVASEGADELANVSAPAH
jgi:hypothetical protein